jgi:hypothetical protein
MGQWIAGHVQVNRLTCMFPVLFAVGSDHLIHVQLMTSALPPVKCNQLLLGGYAVSTQKNINDWLIDALAGAPPMVSNLVASQLDFHLSRYMLHLWLNGNSKVDASCAMYGLDMLIPGYVLIYHSLVARYVGLIV